MKNNIIKMIFLLVIGQILFSCQDVIEVETEAGPERLVVEAWFRNDSLDQEVTLTRTVGFGDTERNNTPEEEAIVRIVTGGGQEFVFTETGVGIYSMSANDFIVHNDSSYTLFIETIDGEQYASTTQTVNPAPAIDAYLFFTAEQVNDLEFGFRVDSGLFFAFSTVENSGIGDAYAWRRFQNGEDISVGADLIFTDDENLVDGAAIPFELSIFGDELAEGDTFRLEQLTISNEFVDFLDAFNDQINGGGPFSTPPAPVEGNLVNINDDTELVLGFFVTSSVVAVETEVREGEITILTPGFIPEF